MLLLASRNMDALSMCRRAFRSMQLSKLVQMRRISRQIQ